MRIIPCAVLCSFLAARVPSAASAQPIVQPNIYRVGPHNRPPKTSTFADNGITLQPYGDSQYGIGSQVFAVKVFGPPNCPDPQNPDTCVERIWFKLAIDSNIVDAVTTQLSSAREYILSRKGSPISISAPFFRYTTKKGTVRQSWGAVEPYGTFRWVPVSGTDGNLSASASIGFTLEGHIEFDATDPGDRADGPTYPGTLYASISPSLAAVFGGTLRSLIFSSDPGDSRWVGGFEYRVGFQFQGKQPISLGVSGTLGRKGFDNSQSSIGISLSKLLGAR